jgi:hypothetical protein
MMVPEDARDAVALEHDLVGEFRIRATGLQIMMPAELLVVVGRRALQRQNVLPPVHDPVVLGEEAVAADIHAVAVVLDRARDAAEFLRGFQHRHIVVIGAAVLDEFPRGSKAGGSTADDHDGFLLRHIDLL